MHVFNIIGDSEDVQAASRHCKTSFLAMWLIHSNKRRDNAASFIYYKPFHFISSENVLILCNYFVPRVHMTLIARFLDKRFSTDSTDESLWTVQSHMVTQWRWQHSFSTHTTLFLSILPQSINCQNTTTESDRKLLPVCYNFFPLIFYKKDSYCLPCLISGVHKKGKNLLLGQQKGR